MTAIDFDSLWDYSKPTETERKFRELLMELSQDDPFSLELLTQIARAQRLQGKEEIGECLLALDRMEEAQPYFATAYRFLSQDILLAEQEPARLERLRQLGKIK